MVRARAAGVSVASLSTGNVQIKGANDLQASIAHLPGYPVYGIVARLFQNQEWGITAHFFAPSDHLDPADVLIRMLSV